MIGCKAKIFGDATLLGYAQIFGNARIKDNNDYLTFRYSWGDGSYFTWTKSDNLWCSGGFTFTRDEFIKHAHSINEKNGMMIEQYIKLVENLNKIS